MKPMLLTLHIKTILLADEGVATISWQKIFAKSEQQAVRLRVRRHLQRQHGGPLPQQGRTLPSLPEQEGGMDDEDGVAVRKQLPLRRAPSIPRSRRPRLSPSSHPRRGSSATSLPSAAGAVEPRRWPTALQPRDEPHERLRRCPTSS